MRALIFGGADIKDYSFCQKYIENSYIVCCDAGMRHAKKLGITPNVIVGDFDSVKDETDMELGLDEAINAGCDEIIITAGIGSRMDHTLANLQLLFNLLTKGIKAKIVNENNEVWLIDKKTVIEGKAGDIVSLVPMTQEVKGVTTTGLEYPLNDDTLFFGSRLLAVSNVMLSEKAEVEIKSGYLYVMKCCD